jgi:methylated-DNA-[protein]-cysteine S-methyltransferase
MPLCRLIASPLGPLLLTVSHGAVSGLTMGSPLQDGLLEHEVLVHEGLGHRAGDVCVADDAESQLGEYFAGVRTVFDLPLGLRGTPFCRSVWAALGAIPFGQTRSYLDIAKAVDPARAADLARAVGRANGANPIGIIVPCHRVIAASGKLSGYAGGVAAKRWLLEHEGQIAGVNGMLPLAAFCGR